MSNTKELNAVKTRLTKEKKAAEAEVRRIDSALQKICAALEELKGTKAPSVKREKATTKATKGSSKRPVGKRNWSDSQKREAAARMKDYWAKKKKSKKGKVARRAVKESDRAPDAAHDAASSPAPQVVVPPQAVA